MVPIESSKCITSGENLIVILSDLISSFSSSVNIFLNNSSSFSCVFFPLNTKIVLTDPFTICLTLYIGTSKDVLFVCVDFIELKVALLEDNDSDIYIKLLLFLI